MKANLRGRIREFLASEEGKVSAKAPLSLGIVGGSFALFEIMFTSPVSANDCLTFCEKYGEELSCTVVCA